MTTAQVGKAEIEAVFPRVAETLADALGCDVEQVTLDISLIDGLGAESIDFLDIIFRLERTFQVKIPRGKILEEARGELPETEFEKDGHLTEVGIRRLRAYLAEVPPDRFRTPMKVTDITRLFTPETFCKLVIRAQQAPRAAPESRPA
jgi:acyl carrier protein